MRSKRGVSGGQPGKEVPDKPPSPKLSPGLNRFLGCCVIIILIVFALWLCVNVIAAIIGLLTGHLYLMGRGGDLTLHGPWARIVSAMILLFFGWVAYRIWKPKKRNEGSGWLPPPSR